ncbi:MAG TPA: peptide deformylase [Candidatus Paceibacterota bacterium]
MKVLPRTEFGNPILRTRTKNVPLGTIRSAEFQSLIKQMIYTMRRTGGVGIAAPQVGRPLRVAVMEMRPIKRRPETERMGPLTIINPRILERSPLSVTDWEGCLSFRGPFGRVPRAKWIQVEYVNENGEKIREKLSGFWARIFQHELDHLDGVVYVDRMTDIKTLVTQKELRKLLKEKA